MGCSQGRLTRCNSQYHEASEEANLKKKKEDITIRSSAAEYLTYVASVGDRQDSIEMRYEDEKYMADAEDDGYTI